MRPIDADALMDYCNNQKGKTIDANDIARFPTIGGWISVKDRLPEKGDDVIIYGYYVGPSGETYPTTIISDIEEFKGYKCVPIAWMPLPEPPEESMS